MSDIGKRRHARRPLADGQLMLTEKMQLYPTKGKRAKLLRLRDTYMRLHNDLLSECLADYSSWEGRRQRYIKEVSGRVRSSVYSEGVLKDGELTWQASELEPVIDRAVGKAIGDYDADPINDKPSYSMQDVTSRLERKIDMLRGTSSFPASLEEEIANRGTDLWGETILGISAGERRQICALVSDKMRRYARDIARIKNQHSRLARTGEKPTKPLSEILGGLRPAMMEAGDPYVKIHYQANAFTLERHVEGFTGSQSGYHICRVDKPLRRGEEPVVVSRVLKSTIALAKIDGRIPTRGGKRFDFTHIVKAVLIFRSDGKIFFHVTGHAAPYTYNRSRARLGLGDATVSIPVMAIETGVSSKYRTSTGDTVANPLLGLHRHQRLKRMRSYLEARNRKRLPVNTDPPVFDPSKYSTELQRTRQYKKHIRDAGRSKKKASVYRRMLTEKYPVNDRERRARAELKLGVAMADVAKRQYRLHHAKMCVRQADVLVIERPICSSVIGSEMGIKIYRDLAPGTFVALLRTECLRANKVFIQVEPIEEYPPRCPYCDTRANVENVLPKQEVWKCTADGCGQYVYKDLSVLNELHDAATRLVQSCASRPLSAGVYFKYLIDGELV